MQKKIEIDGQIVHLKHSKKLNTWRVIYPIKNEDGTLNWFNILTGGSWFNLIVTGIIVLVLVLFFFEYSSNIQTLLDCFENPATLEVCKRSFMPNYPFG